MRNAKRLLAALLLAAALILSSASCGGQTETASEAALPPRLPNRSGITPCRSPRTPCAAQGSTSPPRRTGWGLQTSPQMMNGSCTVEMTKDERDAVCAALKESLHEQIIALPEDGTWPFIKSVTLSEDGPQRRNSEHQRPV